MSDTTSIRDRATAALRAAMKARDKEAVSSLRTLVGEFANAEATPSEARAGALEVAPAPGATEAARLELTEAELVEIAVREIDELGQAAEQAEARGDSAEVARWRHRQRAVADLVEAGQGAGPRVLRYAAFTTEPEGGNPAGVVLDAAGLDTRTMQEIAKEVGFSETAFVTQGDISSRSFTVRYFSPELEVPFCGHATIATGVAIAEREGPGALVLETAAGRIEVDTEAGDGSHRATLLSVPTRTAAADPDDVAAALRALRWSPTELDAGLPPHVSFAGVEHLVLATATRQRLADLDYDFAALKDLMTRRGWTTLQLFWREDEDTFHSRNPFPVGGVVEDPATGAAAAALGGYLRDLGEVTTRRTVRVVQGEDMGRRSELDVTIDPDDPRVAVSGAAVTMDPVSRVSRP